MIGNEKNEFKIRVTTNSFSPFVWLQTDVDGYFSDNGFMMIGVSKTISFISNEGGGKEIGDKLKQSLHVSSLRNTEDLQ